MSSLEPNLSRTRVIPALVRFWRSDTGLSIFLAWLLVFIFLLPPFFAPWTGRSFFADTAFALVLLSGVLALSERGLAWRLLMAAAVATVGVMLASGFVPVATPVIRLTELASLVLLLVVVLGQTFRAGPVTPHRIQGGIAAYLLLGLMWGEAYALVETLHPGAFSGAVGAGGYRGWVYFSFMTLCTVGYGDIAPVHPAARSLAMLEAVTGPLYIAILLARLVSLAVTPGTAKDTREGPGSPPTRSSP
jgi:Ion channel